MSFVTSSAARRGSWLTVSLPAKRPESPVWTWLALSGLLGALVLAVLGVPPVDIHGPLHYAGIMDPFCGATRSVYLTMHGQWEAALRYNPAAPLMLFVAAGLVLRGVAGWWTRRWVQVRMPRRAVIAVAVLALIALEVRQQSNAALLTAPWTGG
ncbi:DUF2752 domain-containing protein [Mycolicibacterium tusciae]|uniref:DUF2752 domain-containing protein n=1 Tax=Mycolicibacterium tusciae TaxID=75922 RepID=UPI00024A3625|nr:DUF2752 domain-containing protein [Mycolicibacterium tusciae]